MVKTTKKKSTRQPTPGREAPAASGQEMTPDPEAAPPMDPPPPPPAQPYREADPRDYDAPGFMSAPANLYGSSDLLYVPGPAACLLCHAVAERGQFFRQYTIRRAGDYINSWLRADREMVAYCCPGCGPPRDRAGDGGRPFSGELGGGDAWWCQRIDAPPLQLGERNNDKDLSS